MNQRWKSAIAVALSTWSAATIAATYVYVSNAEDGDIGTYALQPDGSLRPGARVKAEKMVMPMTVSPDKRFLVAAERTSSSIGAFRVEGASGKLAYLGSTPTEKQPRGFRIDPAGRFMVVSGEKSETLSTYTIDPASGALKLVGKYPTGKGSNWVEIVSFD